MDSTFLPIAGGTVNGNITHGTSLFKSDGVEADTVIVGSNANKCHFSSNASGDLTVDDGTLTDTNRRDITCKNVIIRNITNNADIDLRKLLDIDVSDVWNGIPVVLTSGGRLRSTRHLPNNIRFGHQITIGSDQISRDDFPDKYIQWKNWANIYRNTYHLYKDDNNNTMFTIKNHTSRCFRNFRVDGALTNPSDARAKYNIVEANYESAYNRIKSMQMHSFMYRHPNSDISVEFGMIADKVHEQFPDMIDTQPQDSEESDGAFKDENGDVIPDLKTVNISGMIQVLAAALKHSQTEIDSLKTLVSSLTNRLAALEG